MTEATDQRKKRLYLAGPMRTLPHYNFPAFDLHRDLLRVLGWDVVSPADIDRAAGFEAMALHADYDWGSVPEAAGTLDEIMLRDIEALETCDAIYMMRGWEDSSGANRELAEARKLGLREFYEDVCASPSPSVMTPTRDIVDMAMVGESGGAALNRDIVDMQTGETRTVDASGERVFENEADALEYEYHHEPIPVMTLAETAKEAVRMLYDLPPSTTTTTTTAGETRITDPVTGGQKGSKPAMFALIPSESLWELAELYGYGAAKYTHERPVTLHDAISKINGECKCEQTTNHQNVTPNDDTRLMDYASSVTSQSTQRQKEQHVIPSGWITAKGCAGRATISTSWKQIQNTPSVSATIMRNGCPITLSIAENGTMTITLLREQDFTTTLEDDSEHWRTLGLQNTTISLYQNSNTTLAPSAENHKTNPKSDLKSTTTTQPEKCGVCCVDVVIKPSDCLEILKSILKEQLPTCATLRSINFKLKDNSLFLIEDGADNWRRGYSWRLSFSALMRHLWAFWRGEDRDPESGFKHLTHAAWHCLTLAWFLDNRRSHDDRPKAEVVP